MPVSVDIFNIFDTSVIALLKATISSSEAADTIYHILVTLEAANIKFEDVLQELENRKNQSGIEEKNNRK